MMQISEVDNTLWDLFVKFLSIIVTPFLYFIKSILENPILLGLGFFFTLIWMFFPEPDEHTQLKEESEETKSNKEKEDCDDEFVEGMVTGSIISTIVSWLIK